MDIQGSSAVHALGSALDQQTMGATLISSTIDRMNTNSGGLTSQVNPDYAMQKAVLSSAYADKGIGTKLDMVV